LSSNPSTRRQGGEEEEREKERREKEQKQEKKRKWYLKIYFSAHLRPSLAGDSQLRHKWPIAECHQCI
jgi:hypothetical protein